MVTIELLKPMVIRGAHHKKGSKVEVSRWVASSLTGSKPPRAILANEKASKARVSMDLLYAMEAGGEWKAARKIMKDDYGITASSWDVLLEKAKEVLS